MSERGGWGSAMMYPDKKRTPTVVATWRGMIALAIVVAVASVISWVWRDDFAWGDVLGGLLVGVLTFTALAALRWFHGS
jgi:hypothetical protein